MQSKLKFRIRNNDASLTRVGASFQINLHRHIANRLHQLAARHITTLLEGDIFVMPGFSFRTRSEQRFINAIAVDHALRQRNTTDLTRL